MQEFRIKPAGRFSFGFDELWRHRELFYFFTWRDIKVKYKQTLLGFAWAVLQPLIMMLIFSYFFGSKLKIPSDNIPYPVFVFSGLLVWNIFSTGLTAASGSMVNNANIIKKIYFPRLIIPMSSVLVALFDFLMAFVLYIGILVIYQYYVNPFIFAGSLILSLFIAIITTFGAGCLFAAMNVKYRDFRYIIPFMVQTLLFATPVIYPISIVNNQLVKFLLSLNPMAGSIELIRSVVKNTAPDWTMVMLSIGSAIIILMVGVVYFRKTESYFADLA